MAQERPLSEQRSVAERLRSRATAWKKAATTKEIRDTVTIYEEAAARIAELEKALQKAEDSITEHCVRSERLEQALRDHHTNDGWLLSRYCPICDLTADTALAIKPTEGETG